jgi:hypothetical protein
MRATEEVDELDQDDATELEEETERWVVGMRSCRPEPAAPASGSASGPVRPSKTKDRSRRALGPCLAGRRRPLTLGGHPLRPPDPFVQLVADPGFEPG